MSKRLTRSNPNGAGYRLPLMNTGEGVRIEIAGAFVTIFGEFVDVIGKLEDAAPIEHWLWEAEKIKRNRH